MSGWGRGRGGGWKSKRKDDDDGHEDGGAPPKKNPKRDSSSDDSDTLLVCDISKNRRVSVRLWQGKPVVDIREFYYKDGKDLPGKKGISLSMDQWNILRKHVGEIDAAVDENS
ncbi:hypothetical protein Syun_003298 [Stephania yunnanensis]|uniref:Transcriptional coactivator p15 (PC4) C-terminal domain-containing protein n=1 Tax=Stephania yunnanensis TaxID=152371 RepID=A0AAP0L135_9MAGN